MKSTSTRAIQIFCLVLILQSNNSSAEEEPDNVTTAQAGCVNCAKIQAPVFSPMGFPLLAIPTGKACDSQRRFLIATKNRRGLLLLHSMELIATETNQNQLKEKLKTAKGEQVTEIERQIAQGKELIVKLKSDIAFYANQVNVDSSPSGTLFLTKSVWTIGFFESYQSYLDRITPNVKLGEDFEIKCDYVREARR